MAEKDSATIVCNFGGGIDPIYWKVIKLNMETSSKLLNGNTDKNADKETAYTTYFGK